MIFFSLQDSADSKIHEIVKEINQQTIEWKWSSNKKEEAIQDLFYKIDLSGDSLNVNTYSKILTRYVLKYEDQTTTKKAIERFDLLIIRDINKNTINAVDLREQKEKRYC